MNLSEKEVLVVGGGMAGLSAALELARLNIRVKLVEKTSFLGGHAVQFSCKAVTGCVGCGACVVEEKLKDVAAHPNIEIYTNSRPTEITRAERFTVTLDQAPSYIDPARCVNCGLCLEKCPEPGAVLKSYSKNNQPLYAISAEKCLYVQDRSCGLCRQICPENAIDFNRPAVRVSLETDAVILASGFQAYHPVNKPYGYGVHKNVITNLELERTIRRQGLPLRPSDGKPPAGLAFIQCVGSRDAALNHLWCSKVCCASALRLARLIKSRLPEIDLAFFYIDAQSFGQDFDSFYQDVGRELRLIRAIPGDIYQIDGDRLKVGWYDQAGRKAVDEFFDLVVLSVGLTPGPDNEGLAGMFGLTLPGAGFLQTRASAVTTTQPGVFTAGTASGPMSIPDSAAGAGAAAWETIRYLETL